MTTTMLWGQTQQLTWMHEMRRDVSRWVVVGDVVETGSSTRESLEHELTQLLSDFQLDCWVMDVDGTGSGGLRRTKSNIAIEWTQLVGSRHWAVHVIHSRFLVGTEHVDVAIQPVRLFGYTRDDGRFSVIAAISHLFADGAGLKGLARALSNRMQCRPVQVVSLSDVLSAQSEARRRDRKSPQLETDTFKVYYESSQWSDLAVRERGELVFHPTDEDQRGLGQSLTASGSVLAALGIAWRGCITAQPNMSVPMTVLHRQASPIPGRPYMGPGDLNVVLAAPSCRSVTVASAAAIWRSLVTATRRLDGEPPPEFGTPQWKFDQHRLARTLRLNVHANVSELARDLGGARCSVETLKYTDAKRAFADVTFAGDVVRVKWDLPRAQSAPTLENTFGYLTVCALFGAFKLDNR